MGGEAQVDTLTAKITADVSDFITGMRLLSMEAEKTATGISKEFQTIGSQLGEIGNVLSLAVTAPIVAFGYEAVAAFRESELAVTRLSVGLEATGNACGFTADQLKEMAKGLGEISGHDESDILASVTDKMLKFGTVTGEVFREAQKVIIDYSAQTGTDLAAATQQVGRALESPATGMMMLRRAGIIFNETQKETIKNLEYAGKHAEAQGIILDKLKSKFHGAAQAMHETDDGHFKSTMASIHESMEIVGKSIADSLVPAADAVKVLAQDFAKLSPSVQAASVGFLALAASLGPAIKIFSVLSGWAGSIASKWTWLVSAIGAITAPILATVIVITAAIGILWRFKEVFMAILDLTGFTAWVNSLVDGFKIVGKWMRSLVEDAKYVSEYLGEKSKKWAENIRKFFHIEKKPIEDAGDAAKNAGEKMDAAGKKAAMGANGFGEVSKQSIDTQKKLKDLAFQALLVDENFRGLAKGAPAALKELKYLDTGTEKLTKKAMELNKAFAKIEGLEMKKSDRTGIQVYNDQMVHLNNLLKEGAIDQKTYTAESKKMSSALLDSYPVLKGISDTMATNFSDAFSGVIKGTKDMSQAFADMIDNILASIVKLFADKLFTSLFSKVFSGALAGATGGGSAVADIFSADGNIFSGGNVMPFAGGGVITSPIAFPLNGGKRGIAGEKGPEAIFPLTRTSDGQLGVRTEQGRGQAPQTTQIVKNYNLTSKPVFSLATPSETRRADLAFKKMDKRQGSR